ncbi:hypothetical protein KC887_01430 [Candidatus Kaiserbacteria bacterium]|nr:hypothetical protein [Candidatus Kaiserbacteria bacterium]
MSNQYRIRQYNPGAWCVEELRVVPEINERTGKPNRNPGETWTAIKYPGNLRQASERLLSLVIGIEAEYTTRELIQAVRDAEATISANVAAFVEAK